MGKVDLICSWLFVYSIIYIEIFVSWIKHGGEPLQFNKDKLEAQPPFCFLIALFLSLLKTGDRF